MAGRGLFDPSRARGAKPPSEPRGRSARAGGDEAWSVSVLASRIQGALSAGLPSNVRVRGEISTVRERTHWYFDIKDETAAINCVLFASNARKAGVGRTFDLATGTEVVVEGRVDFYAKSGKVSLIAERVEPVGAGALEAKLRAMVEEIRALGWLDPARKRPLPVFPRRIAVVTSRSGAALQDVIDTARRRCPAVEILVVDARVQGDRAAPEVANALGGLSRRHADLGIDAILVTRGGGSMEDLWAFNERVVAEAIVTSAVPVVAAIGHETDTTVAELVADERCATPTQAAMRLTPDRAELGKQLEVMRTRVDNAVRSQLMAARSALSGLSNRPVMRDPDRMIVARVERLDAISHRLRTSVASIVSTEQRRLGGFAVRLERGRPAAVQARRAERLEGLASRFRSALHLRIREARNGLAADHARLGRLGRRVVERSDERVLALERELAAVSPLAVLSRGYSVTTLPGGTVLRSVGQARVGQDLTTRLADGEVGSTVRAGGDSADALAERGRKGAARATKHTRPRAGKRRWDASQMDLFEESE